MRQNWLHRARELVAVLFVVGLMCPGELPSTVVAADPDTLQTSYVDLTFRGLMVFEKEVRDSKQTIWLLSGAEHHNLRIQIKGPGYDDFLDWGESYPTDAVMELRVTGGSLPTWTTGSHRPYDIAALHSSDGLGELVMRPDVFGPTLMIYSGVFGWTSGVDHDEGDVDFYRTGSTHSSRVPKIVRARITLSRGQKASLTGGGNLIQIDMNAGETWEIAIRNNPDLGSICGYPHFTHYYDGFVFVKYGLEQQVPPDRKYDARGSGAIDCKRGTETRPCIPISH